MQVPVLAIIIPCYNEEEALEQTLNTLLSYVDELVSKQKISEKSFIYLVDDGSKDGTLEVKRPYNYFEADNLYYNLQRDIWQQQKYSNRNKVKKGIPKIIKYTLGALISLPIIFMGYKGIKHIISKLRH